MRFWSFSTALGFAFPKKNRHRLPMLVALPSLRLLLVIIFMFWGRAWGGFWWGSCFLLKKVPLLESFCSDSAVAWKKTPCIYSAVSSYTLLWCQVCDKESETFNPRESTGGPDNSMYCHPQRHTQHNRRQVSTVTSILTSACICALSSHTIVGWYFPILRLGVWISEPEA